MDEQKADTNLISLQMVEEIISLQSDLIIRTLDHALLYKGGSGELVVISDRVVTLDVFLKGRYGTNPILRNIELEVPKEHMDYPIIGR